MNLNMLGITMSDMITPFWRGEFSQWHHSEFVWHGIKFDSCEKWMMFQKAMMFKDKQQAQKILDVQSPKVCKALGRGVQNFNANRWDRVKLSIVIRGNYLKFSQNETLKQLLLDTGSSILVEASPYDNIWGIGVAEENPASINPCQWKGINLLGQALMIVREMIRNDIKFNDKFEIEE